MRNREYIRFKLGRRGRRGRTRYDNRWTQTLDERNISRQRSVPAGRGVFVSSVPIPHNDASMSWEVSDPFPITGESASVGNGAEEHIDDVDAHRGHFQSEPAQVTDPGQPAMGDTDEDIHIVEGSAAEDVPLSRYAGDDTSVLMETVTTTDAFDSAVSSSEEIRSKWRKLCRWQNVFGFLLLHGTGRLSVEQYDVLHAVLNSFMKLSNPSEPGLPTSATIQRSVQPMLRKWGFVESHLRTAELDGSKSGARINYNTTRVTDSNAGSFICVVPSSWSHMDVASKPTWDILKHAALRHQDTEFRPIFSTIESVPMVCEKDKVLDVAHAIIPTRRAENAHASPLLLSERCKNPRVTLFLKSDPRFPGMELISTLSLIGNVVEKQGEFVLQCSALTSTLVSSTNNGSGDLARFDKARRCDILSGRMKAMETAIGDIWIAGDVCTMLKGSNATDCIFVLVQQHVRRMGKSQVMELVRIPLEEDQDAEDICVIRFDKAARHVVSDISVDQPSCDVSVRELAIESSVAPSFGRLKDGRLFFVDHILLYSDGFSQYNFKQGSAGGIYALSLNYPPPLRRSRGRVRVLALTTPGISTMEGIRSVIDDIVTSSTVGLEVHNADGDEMLLFTDVVGYVADYHETSYALDITGQNGKAPCHLCTFLRYNGHPSTASRYGYSTVIHSSDTCYARMGSRTDHVRASRPRDQDLVDIGLNPSEQAESKNSPLHELSLKLKGALETTEIPLTEKNAPVVNPSFDPYRSVLVSPDHVLFGVAVNALNFAFSVLPPRSRRKQVDALFCTGLRRNGLNTESEVFNLQTSKVHSASITTRFCTLLIAPEVFTEVFKNCEICGESSLDRSSPVTPCIDNLGKLRDLVKATYFFPNSSLDGTEAVISFNENGGRTHLAKLELLCEDYITHLNNMCKSFVAARAELDKPNVHRMLELYKHSIPAMGHVRHFAELVFETAHQPLKRAMLRSNFRDSHLQGSLTCIADDWKRRLEWVVNPISNEDEVCVPSYRESELVKLLCGRSQDVVNAIISDRTMRMQATKLVESHPLRKLLMSHPSKLNSKDYIYEWVVSKPITLKKDDASPWCTAMMSVVNSVRNIAKDFLIEEGGREGNLYERASRVKVTVSDSQLYASSAKGHDILRRDTVLSAWVQDEEASCLLHSDGDQCHEAVKSYFAVEALATFNESAPLGHTSGPRSYAAVRNCKRTEHDLLQIDDQAPVQLLALNHGVRRVGLIHACHNDKNSKCFTASGSCEDCDSSILQGHQFYYYGRDRGYPPRMA